MARTQLPERKRRTREHVIADRGINFVERQALFADYSVTQILHDYGLDLVLSTFDDDGELESGGILIQVKATDHLTTVQAGRFVSVRIERADLRAWLTEPMPVILIVYDAQNDQAYWLYVQAEFTGVRLFRETPGRGKATVRIPVDHVLDPNAIRRFRDFRNDILEQRKGVIYRE